MEELQVIETTSGRQFKPWASREDVQAKKQETVQAVVQAVQNPVSVTAIASEIAGGKQAIASAINAKGGSADPLESFQQLAQDIEDMSQTLINQGLTTTEPINFLKFLCADTSADRASLTAIEDNSVDYINTTSTFYQCVALRTVIMTSLLKINGGSSFAGCTSLENITMPNLIMTGSGSFSGCTALRNLQLPSVTTMNGGYTFQNCSNLEYVYLPSLTTVIGPNSFYGCGALKNITLGTLSSYDNNTFITQMPNLRNITIGQNTNINLPFNNWTATNVIAEGQSGIDELNSNIMTNLVPNLYHNGGKTLRLGASLYDVLTTTTKDAITDKGWTLQRG